MVGAEVLINVGPPLLAALLLVRLYILLGRVILLPTKWNNGSVQATAIPSVANEPSSPNPTTPAASPSLEDIEESAPFTAEELALISEIHDQLGDDTFRSVPADLLAQFVRSAHHRPGEPSVAARVETMANWRKAHNVDAVVNEPPTGRDEYELLMPAGVVGTDRHGRPIILERPGRCRRSVLHALDTMSAEAFVWMQVCSKECIRHHMGAASLASSKRIYKFVSIIDCATLGTHHFDRRNIALVREHTHSSKRSPTRACPPVCIYTCWPRRARADDGSLPHRLTDSPTDPHTRPRAPDTPQFKAYAAAVSANYPDCLEKLYVVNAPFVMAGLWRVIQPLLHPVTAAKVTILGTDFAPVLQRDGLRIGAAPGGGASLPPEGYAPLPTDDELEGWVRSSRRLLAEHHASAHQGGDPAAASGRALRTLAEGFVPEADARAIERMLQAKAGRRPRTANAAAATAAVAPTATSKSASATSAGAAAAADLVLPRAMERQGTAAEPQGVAVASSKLLSAQQQHATARDVPLELLPSSPERVLQETTAWLTRVAAPCLNFGSVAVG